MGRMCCNEDTSQPRGANAEQYISGASADDRDVVLSEINFALASLVVDIVIIRNGRADSCQNTMMPLGCCITLIDEVIFELWAHSAQAGLLEREDTNLRSLELGENYLLSCGSSNANVSFSWPTFG